MQSPLARSGLQDLGLSRLPDLAGAITARQLDAATAAQLSVSVSTFNASLAAGSLTSCAEDPRLFSSRYEAACGEGTHLRAVVLPTEGPPTVDDSMRAAMKEDPQCAGGGQGRRRH